MPTKKKSSASKSTKTSPKAPKKASKNSKQDSYDSSSITVLKGLEAVKKRITLKISKKEEELTEHKKKIQRDIESASVNLASVIVEKVVGKTIGKNDIDSISKEN